MKQNKEIKMFVFVGEPATGKTSLARLIGNENALIVGDSCFPYWPQDSFKDIAKKIFKEGYEACIIIFNNKEFANKFVERIHYFNDHCRHLSYYCHFIISLINFERA